MVEDEEKHAEDEELRRLLVLLAEIVSRSGRTQREIEVEMGVSHGWLHKVFKGETDLKVRHILDLGRFLGFRPGQFFRQAYPTEGGNVLDQIQPAIEDIFPLKRSRGDLTARARQQVRTIFREELAKLGLLPGAQAKDEPDEQKGCRPRR
jgi:transcriptional regulator with XRE-family HTH domain